MSASVVFAYIACQCKIDYPTKKHRNTPCCIEKFSYIYYTKQKHITIYPSSKYIPIFLVVICFQISIFVI